MKRVNNLYDSMISYSNILYVFNRIKSRCHNKDKLMRFIRYKNCYLMDILIKLKNNSYVFSNYNIFLIKENKYRIIMSESISDKIVNQMVSYFILLPSLKCLIDSNIATRRGKGSGYGYKLFESYVNKIDGKDIYVLRIDVKKYFYNINHNILIGMLEDRIKDKKAISILKKIISLTNYDYVNDSINNLIRNEIRRVSKLNISDNEKKRLINELNSIPLYKYGKGLSIGCLSNQLMGIFYLNNIDHFIKEELGCKYYIRYMDDIYILSEDKYYLNKIFKLIVGKLKEIDLDINNKSGIYRLKEGVSFLGYTYSIKNNKLLVRYDNNTIRKINRKLNKLKMYNFEFYYRSISSYKGYFIRCNTHLFIDRYKFLCMGSNYDKYLLIKDRYCKYIVFIKYRDRYYTYNEDLEYMNNLLGLDSKYFYKREVLILSECVILDGNKCFIYRRKAINDRERQLG